MSSTLINLHERVSCWPNNHLEVFFINHKWERIFFFRSISLKNSYAYDDSFIFFSLNQFQLIYSFCFFSLIVDLSFSFASTSDHIVMFAFLHFPTYKSHFLTIHESSRLIKLSGNHYSRNLSVKTIWRSITMQTM